MPVNPVSKKVTDLSIEQSEEKNKTVGEINECQEWELLQQGGYFKVTLPAGKQVNQYVNRPVRGKIRGYSRASRHRLSSLCNRIQHSSYLGALFLHLTFAEDKLPEDAEEAHHLLDNFCKWLSRRFNEAPIIWRLEFGEENGRPHFHLLVFANEWVDSSIYEKAWGHGFIRVNWRQSDKVWKYLAKYIGKEQKEEEEQIATDGVPVARDGVDVAVGQVNLYTGYISPKRKQQWKYSGRPWGIRNQKNIKMASLNHQRIAKFHSVDEKVIIRLRRIMRKWHISSNRGKKYKNDGRWLRVRDFKRWSIFVPQSLDLINLFNDLWYSAVQENDDLQNGVVVLF